MEWARFFLVTPLAVIAAFLGLAGAFIVADALVDYSAETDVTYLILGGLSLALAALFGGAALLTISATRQRRA